MTHRISLCNYKVSLFFFFHLSCVIRADGGLHIHAFGVVWGDFFGFPCCP